MKTETSAGIVVFHEKEFLLLHYPEGHWDFPKGVIESGEGHEQAALRETKEETNLEVEIIPGFKQEIHYSFERDGEKTSKTVYFFLGKSKTKDVKLSWEHTAFAWLSYEKALQKLTFENAKDLLRKAKKFLET